MMHLDLTTELRDTLGAANVDSQSRHDGLPPDVVVRPAGPEQVAAVLRACARHRRTVVPQGGLTGLVGSAPARQGEVALSLSRMARVLDVDMDGRSILVEAGALLQVVQRAAETHGLKAGLDIGARGSCTIGGMVATNAGGAQVVRHGMTRQHVLGLEVVLADGSVLSSLSPLTKDNAGYDLKQLFIGSEGTLGIVTKVRLRLVPPAVSSAVALVAVADFKAALSILALLRARADWALAACEIMWGRYYDAVVARLPSTAGRAPVAPGHPIYLLIEVDEIDDRRSAADLIASLLESVDPDDLVLDGAIAQSLREREAIWAIRDGSDLVERAHPLVQSFDVSLRPRDYLAYLDAVEQRLAVLGGCVLYGFGHLADGNIHCLVGSDADSPARRHAVEAAIYGPLAEFPYSSVSAEHGIGLEKRPYLALTRSPAEIAAMRRLRQAFDPEGLLSPGRIF